MFRLKGQHCSRVNLSTLLAFGRQWPEGCLPSFPAIMKRNDYARRRPSEPSMRMALSEWSAAKVFMLLGGKNRSH